MTPEAAINEIKKCGVGTDVVKFVENMASALKEINMYNRIRNDKEMYLWDLAEFALGKTEQAPQAEDYGL